MLFMTVMNIYDIITVRKELGHPYAIVRHVANILMPIFFFFTYNINQNELKTYFGNERSSNSVILPKKVESKKNKI